MTGEDSDAALVITTLVLATTFTPIKGWLEAKVAARKGVIVDPDEAMAEASRSHAIDPGASTTSAGPAFDDDARAERIAERAAAIVLARLTEGTATPTAAPRAQRPTLE
jgi:hypothetical protein